MYFHELKKESYIIAKEKGFHGYLRSIPEVICLLHSEVSEALECYRDNHMVTTFRESDGKPEGFPSEIADIVIRLADTCQEYEYYPTVVGSLNDNVINITVSKLIDTITIIPPSFTDVPFFLALIHKGIDLNLNISEICHKIFPVIYHLCKVLSIDLEYEINKKMEYNKTREYMHGRKNL